MIEDTILCLFVWGCFGGLTLFFQNINDANNTPEQIEARYQARH